MILGVIPARGGSKGLPGKNIHNLNGKPLISWSIESGLSSSLIDRLVVSTDSVEIANISKLYGAEIDMRPKYLATDDSTTISVLNDLIDRHPDVDTIVVLQPTSPIRDKDLIDKCIRIYRDGGYSNLATGFKCKYKEYGSHNNLRRQDIDGFFYDDGNVYVLSRDLVESGIWFGKNYFCYEIPKHMNFEIDDALDFVIVEALMANINSI
tara:strand:- start:418 stop:1044 length:627 start_codon:yes stop_codon:yes gene_type:complete